MDASTQQHELIQKLLFRERHPASEFDVARYFGPRRLPGTTSIGFRKTRPDIFQDTLDTKLEGYDEWLKRSVTRTARSVIRAEGGQADSQQINGGIDRLVEKVASILEYPSSDGAALADLIPQQLYEDAFVRIISYIRHPQRPGHEPHLYRDFNALCHRIGQVLLEVLDKARATDGCGDDITQLIRIAVLSGHVGINLKSSASAASALLNKDILPLPRKWIETPSAIHHLPLSDLEHVAQQMIDIAGRPEGQFGMESLRDYFMEVADGDVPTLLVFFCDDYLESMIDMKRFEVMLARNPKLRVLFIPRAGRYGNDLAVQDVPAILQEAALRGLQALARTGCFQVSGHGPRAGCIDMRDVSRELIGEIDALGKGRRIIFETKGCRNFEMLKGQLAVPWYASFNCNRALSIRTVQVDGPPVFLRIPPGLNAYDGFTRPKLGYSPSYTHAEVRFARMTALDLYQVLKGPLYSALLKQNGDELQLNRILMALCQKKQVTLAEIFNKVGEPAAARAGSSSGAIDRNKDVFDSILQSEKAG
jgi:hypothetical protein